MDEQFPLPPGHALRNPGYEVQPLPRTQGLCPDGKEPVQVPEAAEGSSPERLRGGWNGTALGEGDILGAPWEAAPHNIGPKGQE